MILTKLTLENFKRYKTYELNFGEGLIGIIGKNGSGKSTIFEALLVALYGEPKRNKGYKETLRNANASTKDAVVVELEFEFDTATYQIRREFRGKALTTNAKLFKNSELISSGAKEVTESIVRLTKMSKDAFLHTLFASQKELTSLSTSKPEERKKMIRKLLGLEKIDFIENLLIEKSRELKRQLQASNEFLLSKEDIETKQENIKENKANKEELSKQSELKTKEITSLKEKEFTCKKELDEFVKTKEAKQKALHELKLLANNIETNAKTKEKLVVELKELELKAKELEKSLHVKKEYEAINAKLKEQEKLKNIQIKKEGLEKEQVSLREQYTKGKNDIKVLEEACKDYDKLSLHVKKCERELTHLKEEINKAQNEQKTLLAKLAADQRVVDDTKAKMSKIQELGRESACPTCTRQLLDEYDNVLGSLEGIITQTQNQKIDKTKEALHVNEKCLKELEVQRQAKEKDSLESMKALNLIESKQKDLLIVKEHFKKVETKGKANKEELAKLASFTYDEALHVKIQNEQKALHVKYEQVLQLETKLQRVGQVTKELEFTCKELESLHVKKKSKEEEANAIVYDEAKHGAKTKEFEALQSDKDKQITLQNELKVTIAKCEGEIKTIQNDLNKNDESLKKVQKKKDDLSDYEKIKLSLAEFKTLLNAKVAPRISQFASQMYATITKGKYQHIEVNNDFDFFIYDEGVKYPIERFSGGEVDLANLVLRIAISKTLGELSGASSVGFLAFDEVFGSQDESRRMEILEAFHMIKEQYRQIFLISHEMEIKEMFERVVEV